jgi:carbon starvation protein
MRRPLTILLWVAISALGAVALGRLALSRGESISAGWLLAAALCCYAIGYRYYGRFIATKIFAVDDRRPTPAVRLEDGRDYLPTDRWVVFGHHFAAIAGPGPLVGPTLAAQFGFLPGAIWIVAGVVLGGAVQDLVILLASVRRNGRSLGAMARDEIGPVAGTTALVAILGIMVVLIAVLALVVVNALAASPWGVVTIGLTIPIALLMGVHLRWLRPGRVLEASAMGLVLLVGALYAGRWVAAHPDLAAHATLTRQTLALAIMVYGFAASVLPVWLLLAPRDYLSAFVKIGVVLALALGLIVVLPPLQMPALTRFAHGGGPIFAGTIFPFAFITIACGAISGFHALIASGTTPKLLACESDALLVGYGGMLMESFVAIMALIAACLLTPGVYFAINASAASLGPSAESASRARAQGGCSVNPHEIRELAAGGGAHSAAARWPCGTTSRSCSRRCSS